MSRNEVGMLAMSKSGHDRGQLYVIIREEDGYIYLADGRHKLVDSCKKKNRRHIQIIHTLAAGVGQKLQQGESVTNEEIKRAIKLYQKE